MSKLTLLQITQDILSDMNSDDVSSITDTIESLQVVQIIESTYNELIARKNWPHTRKLIQLEASGSSTKPTHMKAPEVVKEIVEVNYNKKKSTDTREKWSSVKYLYPDEFLRMTNGYNTDNTNTDEITDYSGVKFLIKTDKAPDYYTSFDDEYFVFDSYDSDVDSTLQATKTQVVAFTFPTFTVEDDFIPDLPIEMFPAFLAECKSVCFARIKQTPDAKAEQQSRRSMNWLSNKSWQVNGGWRFPDWGRKGKK
jgi:hypothetical protein